MLSPCPAHTVPSTGTDWEDRTVGRDGGRDTEKLGLALPTVHPPQEEATPSTLGHQIGLLLLLCRDKDEVTSSHSCRCVCLCLQLLIQQKGELRAGRGPHGGVALPRPQPVS